MITFKILSLFSTQRATSNESEHLCTYNEPVAMNATGPGGCFVSLGLLRPRPEWAV